MQIDPLKIAQKIAWLQSTYGGEWIVAPGEHALTKVELPDNKPPTFYGNEGIPIKIFMRTDTGEIKLFPITRFTI